MRLKNKNSHCHHHNNNVSNQTRDTNDTSISPKKARSDFQFHLQSGQLE